MVATDIRSQLFARIFRVLTKFVLVLIMLFSIILLFFVGSGVIKPSKSWNFITKEESMK